MHKEIAFTVTTWIFLAVQNAPSVYKIIWYILGLCTYGTVDVEICDKYELWKIIYRAYERKAAHSVCLRISRKSSPH